VKRFNAVNERCEGEEMCWYPRCGQRGGTIRLFVKTWRRHEKKGR